MPVFIINGCRVLFIHVPKNAGTTLTHFLGQYSEAKFDSRMRVFHSTFRPRHLHSEHLEQIFFKQMFDYAFMVVRHPVSRVLSEYFYQRRRNAGLRWQQLTAFDAWLKYSLWRADGDPGYWENHFRRQIEFECMGCEVFHLEKGLEAVVGRLAEVTGAPLGQQIPILNQQPRSELVLTPTALRLIGERYARDFERYGYTREDI